MVRKQSYLVVQIELEVTIEVLGYLERESHQFGYAFVDVCVAANQRSELYKSDVAVRCLNIIRKHDIHFHTS